MTQVAPSSEVKTLLDTATYWPLEKTTELSGPAKPVATLLQLIPSVEERALPLDVTPIYRPPP